MKVIVTLMVVGEPMPAIAFRRTYWPLSLCVARMVLDA